jgi:pyridoxamine 5'-phosphate oxidase
LIIETVAATLLPVAAGDPLVELVADRERARAAGDPFADLCILATADAGGRPAVRTIVLRDTGPQGIGLLVSGTSPQWEPLQSGRYECLLPWLTIRRQYRLRGLLDPMPVDRLEGYWQHKVHTSRLLDVYYEAEGAQSSEVPSREAFLQGIAGLQARYPDPQSVPRPEGLRGVYLQPRRIEIWRGSPDRLHDRRLFTREGTGWVERVLVP